MEAKQFNGRKYTYNRAKGRYEATTVPHTLLSRDLWEATHGQLQKGEVVHHRNEHPAFDDPANLEKRSRGDHTRHHKHTRNLERLPRGVKVRRKGEKWYVFINWQGHRKAVCVGLDKENALMVAWGVWYWLRYPDSANGRNPRATTDAVAELAVR
jgi:hypothetical protein